jgi:hypothetical protein
MGFWGDLGNDVTDVLNFGKDNRNDKNYRGLLQDYYNQMLAGKDQAPQMGPAAQGQYSGFRQNQSALIGRLENMTSGQGPSVAAQQFQQAADRNQSQQQAMAQSGRGGPLGAFNAMNNMQNIGMQAAQGSATARLQEQQAMMGELEKSIYGARGADEAMNQFNAGEQNKVAIQNLDARLRAMGIDDQTRLGILSQMGAQNKDVASRKSIADQFLAGATGTGGAYTGAAGGGGGVGAAEMA